MSDGTQPPSGDQATVSVFVAVEPDDAFAVFTEETDLWWRRGLKYRLAGRRPGVLCFEPGVGGRLFESFETESGTQVYETGRITVWEPPRRLVVKWRNPNFASNESTELEVLFEPSGDGHARNRQPPRLGGASDRTILHVTASRAPRSAG